MKIKAAIAVLFFISFSVSGLDIYLNDSFFAAYSREELIDLSIPTNETGTREVLLMDLLPLMESVQYIEGISPGSRFAWEEDVAQSTYRTSKLQLNETGIAVYGAGNRFSTPSRINIYGTPLEIEELRIWVSSNNSWLEQEIKTFGRLHNIRTIIETHQNPWYDYHDPQNNEIPPHIVIIEGRTAYLWETDATTMEELLIPGEKDLLPNISETWFLPLAYRMPLLLSQDADMDNDETPPFYGDFFGEDWFMTVTGSLFLENTPLYSSESRDFVRLILTETKEGLNDDSFIQTDSGDFPPSTSSRFYPAGKMPEAVQYINEGFAESRNLSQAFAVERALPLPLESLAVLTPSESRKESQALIQYLRGPAVQYGIGIRSDWFSIQEILDSDSSIIPDNNEVYLYWGSAELDEKAREYSSLARLYYNNLLNLEELLARMLPDE